MPSKAFETKLNAYLGNILSDKLGVNAVSEIFISKKRPDILIYVGGVKVIIEGSYSKSDAEKDVKKKIELGQADIGIALHYKCPIPDVEEKGVVEKIKEAKFDIKLFLFADLKNALERYLLNQKIISKSLTEWFEVDIVGLATLIENIYYFLVAEEFIEKNLKNIEEKSNDFVNRMKSLDRKKEIAKKLYEVFYKSYGLSVGNFEEIAELIYAKAYLTLLLSVAFYMAVHAQLGLPSISTLMKRCQKEGLRKAFEYILELNYKPIYNLAIDVLEWIPEPLLREIIFLGTTIGSNPLLLRRDFSGRLYHKIVGDWSVRKGFATFFTKIPAAYLLAYLTVFSEFGKMQEPCALKVCDFACGSGTLLSAIYSALEDLYKLENFEEGEIDLEAFHKKMLEEVIWGFDALRYAVQIASLNLISRNPTVGVKDMNFYAVPLGIDSSGEVMLGSLKFLNLGSLVPYIFGVYELADKTAALDTLEESKSLPRSFDVIIMNPPFTRATGRGGRERGGLFGFILDEEVRGQVLKEYKKVRELVKKSLIGICKKQLKNFSQKTFLNVGQAGEGLLFLFLAHQHLKREGRLAFVLPKSLLSGASWFLARCLLAQEYHLEYVIVSYDKEGGYNFSESTNLSEALIIARKVGGNIDMPTKFVMLLKKPETIFEAISLARAICRGSGHLVNAGRAQALVMRVKRKTLLKMLDNWGRFAAFPALSLNRLILDLEERGELWGKNVPLCKLGELADMGIDRHQFHELFKVMKRKIPDSFPVIYGGGEEQRSQMKGSFNAFVYPRDSKAKQVFREKASFLLVPDRIWLETAHVIALLCDKPTLSNIFYAVRIKGESNCVTLDHYKALCLWLNSTFGLLIILANRQETRGPWISLKISHWKLQKVLDIRKLDREVIKKLAGLFDKLCNKKMRRLPYQCDPDDPDPIRLQIDEGILDALGIRVSDQELLDLYRSLYDAFRQWLF